jgi:regulatory associated protein of mTOR
VVSAVEYLQEERARSQRRADDDTFENQFSRWTIFGAIWRTLLLLTEDPFPDVAVRAKAVVDSVFNAVASLPHEILDEVSLSASPTAERQSTAISNAMNTRINSTYPTSRPTTAVSRPVSRPASRPTSSSGPTTGGGLYHTLRRTASVAYNLALGSEYLPPERVTPAPNVPPAENEARPAPPIELRKPFTRSMTLGPKAFKQPLESCFFEWSTEYFQRPQMKDTEAEEPGSLEYNKRLWRRARNESVINETQPEKEVAGASTWQHTLGILDNEFHQPAKLLFHQFEPHLVIADDRDAVFVWNWHTHTRLNSFSNGNREGARISAIKFINEDDVALLMVGSSDGNLKVYRNYENPEGIELLTAWRALSDLGPTNRSAGLVVEWQQ